MKAIPRKILIVPLLLSFLICRSQTKQETYPLSDAANYVNFLKNKQYAKAYALISIYRADNQPKINYARCYNKTKIFGEVAFKENYNVFEEELKAFEEELKEVNDSTRIDVKANSLNPLIPKIELTNIFKKEYFDIFNGIVESSSDASSQNDFSSLSGPLADALATVVAKRFKEELTIAFLNNFRDTLESNKDLGELFPKTLAVLLNEDVFNISLWLTTLRGALDEDLRALPQNVPNLIRIVAKKANFDADATATLNVFKSLYSPTFQLISSPESSYLGIRGVLDSLTSKKANILKDDVREVLTLSKLVLTELGNTSKTDWAKKVSIENLIKNPKVLSTFLGLIIEKNRKKLETISITTEYGKTNLYKFFSEGQNVDMAYAMINHVKMAVNSVLKLSSEISVIKSRSRSSKLTYEDYVPLVNDAIGVFRSFTDDVKWFETVFGKKAVQVTKLNSTLADVQNIVSFSLVMKENIDSRSYSKVLSNLLDFLPKLVNQDQLDNSIFFAQFVEYANLAVSLTGAQNSEEMVAVIEAAALPVQSYRLKRTSPFSITLNAYAGIFGGVEILTENDVANETAGLIGFSAPIGVGLNWAIRSKKKKQRIPAKIVPEEVSVKGKSNKIDDIDKRAYFGRNSISLFVSVIDVGALTAFRLKDDETPFGDIRFQNIFAPGGHLIFGFGDMPISLGVGAQWGPELRNVTSTEGSDIASLTVDSNGWRFGASLLVDIPLLQLHRKPLRIKEKPIKPENSND